MVFAYFGPETILPATSTLAAIFGFILMFGRHACHLAGQLARRIFRVVRPKPRSSAVIPRPHLPGFRSRPAQQVELQGLAAPWTGRNNL
jgi:hypothetical protein